MTAATRTATKVDHNLTGQATYIWEGLDGDDVGSVVKLPGGYDSLTVQLGAAGGNTDGSATTVMQGSMDAIAEVTPASAVWFTLTEKDTASTAVSRTTSAVLKEVKEKPLFIRPSQSGGTAGYMDVIATVR